MTEKKHADIKKEKSERAVAMRYDKKKESAPRVIAVGRGNIARKIIDIAKSHNIPLYRDADLLEVLSKIDIGKQIPVKLYRAIAEILVFVYSLNKKRKDKMAK